MEKKIFTTKEGVSWTYDTPSFVVNIFFSIGENSIISFKFSLQFRVNSL